MKVGVCVGAMVADVDYIVLAEQLGYESAWVADSQLIWSDCYAVLALAAARTSRIRLGTGVSIAGTRIAPVTASSIATINELAPGRVFLGLGTGHTAMRTMGQGQMRLPEFREYVRVVRDLLDGKNTPYTFGGVQRDVTLMHHGRGYYRIEPRIPIHVSALGPLTQRWAGGVADSVVLSGVNPRVVERGVANIRAGAARAGRVPGPEFEVTSLLSAVVLEPGESLESERVVDETGSWVTNVIHYAWEAAGEPKRDPVNAPAFMRSHWGDYCDHVERMETPAERRYQQVHLGHCSFLTEAERRFVTPEAIRATTLAGTPDELVEQIRSLERAGLTRILLLPPVDHARKVLSDFAEQVLPRV